MIIIIVIIIIIIIIIVISQVNLVLNRTVVVDSD